MANRHFLGSYILRIGDFHTFSPDDVSRAIAHYRALDIPPAALRVRLAVDQRTTLSESRPPPLALRPVDIRRIAALKLVAGEGDSPQALRDRVRRIARSPDPLSTPCDPDDLIEYTPEETLLLRKLANSHMTDEERKLPSFTRRRLQQLANWSQWLEAERTQLDAHYDSGTIGKAVDRPPPDVPEPSALFRIQWSRAVKADGKRKARACVDGSKRSAPWLRNLVQTYSSCVEIPCVRLFIAECVNRGYYICFGDVNNAFQQAPPPDYKGYLEIDDAVFEWYQHRFGETLDRRTQVIPMYKNLQGQPDAGVLWERMINDILINKMGFRTTTHERNLYIGEVDGKSVLVCRQVDDFAAGAATEVTARKFLDVIRSHVEAEFDGMGVETPEGIYEHYNGLDIHQTRDYVKISVESYIMRVMQTHGWDTPSSKESAPTVPMSPTVAERLQKLEGPVEKSPEARQIEKEVGFSYRNVLGELMYAYVVARLDIGFAVCLLARFSGHPHREHYNALKGVCLYLRKYKDWGIMYHRPSPLDDLPDVPFEFVPDDPNLPPFPEIPRNGVTGILDAAHATDLKHRKSVMGILVLFGGSVIAFKSKLTSLVATSSTEAEFYAAVFCAKLVKYFRYVLQELEALAPGPSILYIDNEAALHMINERRPTPRARHVEVQHFAILEWRENGDILMRHMPGAINPSDGLTKALATILHHRHARRAMGHYQPVSNSVGSD